MQKLYGTRDVARLVGCAPEYIAIRTNVPNGIKGEKVGSVYIYKERDVEDFVHRYKPHPVEKKKKTRKNKAKRLAIDTTAI